MTFPNQDVRLIIVLKLFNNMVNDIDILTYNKITYFQIGDFIKFRQEIFLTDQDGVETTQDIVYEIGKICALNNIGNVWVNDCEGQEYQITVDEIEPIPLTSEIMEKNGFNLYPEETNVFILNAGYRHDLDTVCLYIGDIERPSIYGNGSLGEKTYVVLHCKYVHEFQHVLKMCGINKKIVL